jgi:hypothetical protein
MLTETITSSFEGLKETSKYYEYHNDIVFWDDNNINDKKNRLLSIELDKPLKIYGDFIVNGYVRTLHPFSVQNNHIYKVGDNYKKD